MGLPVLDSHVDSLLLWHLPTLIRRDGTKHTELSSKHVLPSAEELDEFTTDRRHKLIARIITLNTWYFVLMKNLIDFLQVDTIDRLIYPGKGKAFLKAYEDALGSKDGYLIVDMSPRVDDQYLLKCSVFPGQDPLEY